MKIAQSKIRTGDEIHTEDRRSYNTNENATTTQKKNKLRNLIEKLFLFPHIYGDVSWEKGNKFKDSVLKEGKQ